MNWYLQTGKESDIVISSRIRLARNLDNVPFTHRFNNIEAYKVLEKIKEITPSLEFGLKFLKISDMDDITKMSLIEKHIISPELIKNNENIKAILINEEENICIMINEEDHLRIQVLSSGLELENLLNIAMNIDKKIENLIDYAYSDKYGFLTSCPSNVGTGMRVSVMVHLPALTLTGNISKILDAVSDFGMYIRGIYGEETESQGNIYQISNKQSLGVSEEEIIKNTKVIIDKIIEQERLARKYLSKNQVELEDEVYRSFGILTNCRKISYQETEKLLSNVKLGTDMGIIKELTDLKVKKLEVYTKPATMQSILGNKIDAYTRDIKRAELIKSIIQEK